MTNEEINIAIAEACGYKTGYRDPEAWHPLPDYLNDLNAMHDAEEMLIGDEPENSELWCDFQTNLVIACPAYLSYHATASQRAEAFLKTIGKWKE